MVLVDQWTQHHLMDLVNQVILVGQVDLMHLHFQMDQCCQEVLVHQDFQDYLYLQNCH